MAFFKLALPSTLWQFRRYGLFIDEQNVTFVSWKKGSFERLGEFVNDTQGLADFEKFIKARPNHFTNKNINVCVGVVGEDYRFEKVAHLVGKYRTDMLKRKFQQLFRGTTYQMAIQHAREPVGRRQDLILFCGILSNEKVHPWVRDATRAGMNLAGVHLGSLLTESIFKIIVNEPTGVNVISVVSQSGSLRHNFYIDGDMRFSRQSRFNEEAPAEDIYRAIRSELEKTVSYLTSVKLLTAATKIKVSFVCSEDMVDNFNDVAAKSESDRYLISAVSARIIGGAIGIKNPIAEYGRDSSLVMHEMLRSVFFNQLAPLNQIRYYLLQSSATLVGTAAILWSIFHLIGTGGDALNTYNNYSSKNGEMRAAIATLKENYENQISGFGTPPSSPTNMRSSVNVLDNAVSTGNGPGRMMLFISSLLTKYPAMKLDSLSWYISNQTDSKSGELSFANGQKAYEVIEVLGTMDENFDAQIAFNQYNDMIAEIQSRSDMSVIEQDVPALIEAGGALNITIDTRKDIKNELNKLNKIGVRFTVAWDSSEQLSGEAQGAGEGQ